MGIYFLENGVDTALSAAGQASGSTSLVLASGLGARWSVPTIAWVYNATQYPDGKDPAGEYELVTGRSGDTLTVVRGQEGTSQQNFTIPPAPAGTIFKARNVLTKGFVEQLRSRVDELGKTGFRARLSANQTGIVPNVDTKLLCNTEEWDLAGEYDNSINFRYTATKPATGIAVIQAGLISPSSNKFLHVKLFKNGALYPTGRMKQIMPAGTVDVWCSLTCPIKLTTSDYLEAFVLHDDSVNRDIDSNLTFFSFIGAGDLNRI